MTERLSRPERRALQAADALILPRPLAMNSDPRPIAAHVRHVVRLLRKDASGSPAEAAAHVSAVFDRTIEAMPKTTPPLACRKHCAHCCTQMVVLTAPEAFLVAANLRRRARVVTAIKEAYGRSKGLALDARLHEKIACPLLEEAACSVYDARPLGCRGFVSVDLESCLAAFTRGAEPHIPMPQSTVDVLYACRLILKVGLRLAGLPEDAYEMHAALATILDTENAPDRWRGGENIFAGLEGDSSVVAHVEQEVRQMADFVRATV